MLQAGPFDIIRHLMELRGLRQKDLGVSTRNTSVLVDITRNEEHNHSAIERAFSFPRSKYLTIQHSERAMRKAIVFLGLVVATSACFSQTEQRPVTPSMKNYVGERAAVGEVRSVGATEGPNRTQGSSGR